MIEDPEKISGSFDEDGLFKYKPQELFLPWGVEIETPRKIMPLIRRLLFHSVERHVDLVLQLHVTKQDKKLARTVYPDLATCT